MYVAEHCWLSSSALGHSSPGDIWCCQFFPTLSHDPFRTARTPPDRLTHEGCWQSSYGGSVIVLCTRRGGGGSLCCSLSQSVPSFLSRFDAHGCAKVNTERAHLPSSRLWSRSFTSSSTFRWVFTRIPNQHIFDWFVNSFHLMVVTLLARYLETKKPTTIMKWRAGTCVALIIYEQMRSRKPFWVDMITKSREGALICPSGRTFTELKAPYVPRTAPNVAAELMWEVNCWRRTGGGIVTCH